MSDAPDLTMQLSVGRTSARLPLVRRAIAGTCSRAGLPVDRIDDAILIAEALLGEVRSARAEQVNLILTARPGSFAMLMGPFADSTAEELLVGAALPTVGPVVEQLATVAMAVDDGSRLLVVVDAA